MIPSDLHLETDRSFQLRFWRVQRFCWFGFALILLIALAGFTGKGGPFARTVATSPQGKVEYPRVLRWQTGDEIVITLPPGTAQSTSIDLDAGFLKLLQVEQIQPTPKQSYTTGGGQRLVFDVGRPGGSKNISFIVRPLHPAISSRIRVRINDGDPLALTPVILP